MVQCTISNNAIAQDDGSHVIIRYDDCKMTLVLNYKILYTVASIFFPMGVGRNKTKYLYIENVHFLFYFENQ